MLGADGRPPVVEFDLQPYGGRMARWHLLQISPDVERAEADGPPVPPVRLANRYHAAWRGEPRAYPVLLGSQLGSNRDRKSLHMNACALMGWLRSPFCGGVVDSSPGHNPIHRTHNPARPRYCENRPPTPTIKDHPVSPPTSEEAGGSIVIRRPRPRGRLRPGSRILRGRGTSSSATRNKDRLGSLCFPSSQLVYCLSEKVRSRTRDLHSASRSNTATTSCTRNR